MTECERLIANGTFTRDFFKPEVRCDFLVDENRKKIWAILLDLLMQFDAVCKKHDLHYFMICGSLLGAIRHNGLIPWDDDIDVGMPRPDYDKFIKLVDEFTFPYMLQVPGDETGSAYSSSKVRNVNTTEATKLFAYESFNQGVFLDVGPLDGVADPNDERDFNRIRSLVLDNSTCMRMSCPDLDDANRERVRRCVNTDRYANGREIDRLASRYNIDDCDYIGLNTTVIYPHKKIVYPKCAFESSLLHRFECIDVPIPVGFEEVLRIHYGDYMQMPPVEQRGIWHGGLVLDPDLPYDTWRQRNKK